MSETPTLSESALQHADELAKGLAVQGSAAEWLTREFIPSAIAAIRGARARCAELDGMYREQMRLKDAYKDQFREAEKRCAELEQQLGKEACPKCGTFMQPVSLDPSSVFTEKWFCSKCQESWYDGSHRPASAPPFATVVRQSEP